MADFNDIMNYLSNGKIGGIPVIMIIMMSLFIILIIYLIITRKTKEKPFKPLDLKKETRKRYNEQYKFFGHKLGMDIYEPNARKPFGYVIGYMKAVWLEQFKRYEPIHTIYSKEEFLDKIHASALEVYRLPFEQLNDLQKKNIHQLAKEELRNETADKEKVGEKTRIVRGKKEIIESIPKAAYMMKITRPSLLYKIIASFSNIGSNWYIFDSEQLEFTDKSVLLTADYQREIFNSIFVFSKAGKNLVEDIAFGVEREEVLSATANQIPRTLHFGEQWAGAVLLKREDSKLQDERFKHQKESNE